MSQPNIQSKVITAGLQCSKCFKVFDLARKYSCDCEKAGMFAGYFDEDDKEYTKEQFKQWQLACELAEQETKEQEQNQESDSAMYLRQHKEAGEL
jgi:hypothetical protein